MTTPANEKPSADISPAAANEAVREVQGLFLRHADLMRGFVFGLIGNWAATEDVLQEVFLTVTAKAVDFRPGSDFAAWARRIARYKVLEALRRSRRSPAALDMEVLETLAEHADEDDDAPPEEHRAALRDCLRSVPPKTREMIELRYREEPLPPREIARRLSWSANAVRVALARVRKTLHDCVARRLNRDQNS